MAKIQEYYNTGDDNDASLSSTSIRLAQTMQTVSSYELYSVKCKVFRNNNPGTVTLSIFAANATTGKPEGSALTSGTLDASAISVTPGEFYEFVVTPYTLASSTLYSIVLSGDSVGGANSLGWRYKASGTYGNGTVTTFWFSTNSGSTWSQVNVNQGDAMFEMYSTAPAGAATPTDNATIKKLFAIGNNEMWYEDSEGSMASLSVACSTASGIATTRQMTAFEGYSKVFVVNGSILRVADFINTKLATADILPSASLAYPRKGTVLTGATSSAQMVVDYVTAADSAAAIYGYVTAGTFSSVEIVTGTDVATSTAVSITLNAVPVSSPHIYNWTRYANSSSFGTMPEKSYLSCLYRGRTVLAGNPAYPNQWYMSRQANPWDFAYKATDSQTPVAGNNADAGETGDIIRCLIPYGDDYLVFGCASEIWLLRGDPAAGGSMDRLNGTTGIFGPYSWCFDSARNLYFWGNQGVYRMSPDFTSIVNLTQNVLPNITKDEAANPDTHRITFGYDQLREGIIICITNLTTGVSAAYWYDIRTEGFFPESYPQSNSAYSQYYYNANATSLADLLVGCTDGYIRVFDDSAKDDDTGATDTAISSHVLIGPIAIGQDPDGRGRMQTLTVVTGRDTDAADCEIYAKDTAEEIVDSYAAASTPFNTISLAAGRPQKFRPRTRAGYLGLAIKNAASTETWSFEKAVATIKPAGTI